MATAGPASLESLYDALDDDAPLDLDRPEDRPLYVSELHDANGINPANELLLQIRRGKSAGTWFFTGHRGVGKSTELRRIAHELRQEGHVVAVADMGDYLNLAEEISIELLLLTMMAALSAEATRLGGANPLDRSFAVRLRDYLTRTTVQADQISAGLSLDPVKFDVKAQLKNNPVLRERVVAAVQASLGDFVAEVRSFAKETVTHIQAARPNAKVVLILDSLERLRVSGTDAAKRYDAIQKTFEVSADYLKFDTLNVVYSIPPYMPYLSPKLGSYFGVGICTLPHAKIFERPRLGGPRDQVHQVGVDAMLLSLEKRYPQAGEVIPVDLLTKLVFASSGSVREFFRLVRTACTKAMLARESLPMRNMQWIDAAQQDLLNEMPLADEDRAWLKKVRTTHGTGLDKIENLPKLARLFDSGLILGYRNSADWCDVHYLLRAEVDRLP